jgi:hypothetical protein
MESMTLYSSWRGVLVTLVSPVFLIALGSYGLALDGWVWLPALVLAAGLVLLAITLFDFPLRAEFRVDGIARHMPLRTHLLAWQDVTVLERFRKRRVGVPRWLNVGKDVHPRPVNPGGLVVLTGTRRRYLLVNRGESRGEYDELIAALEAWAPDFVVQANRPHAEVVPTFLYRRKQ